MLHAMKKASPPGEPGSPRARQGVASDPFLGLETVEILACRSGKEKVQGVGIRAN
jgi:hypothetical protein